MLRYPVFPGDLSDYAGHQFLQRQGPFFMISKKTESLFAV